MKIDHRRKVHKKHLNNNNNNNNMIIGTASHCAAAANLANSKGGGTDFSIAAIMARGGSSREPSERSISKWNFLFGISWVQFCWWPLLSRLLLLLLHHHLRDDVDENSMMNAHMLDFLYLSLWLSAMRGQFWCFFNFFCLKKFLQLINEGFYVKNVILTKIMTYLTIFSIFSLDFF